MSKESTIPQEIPQLLRLGQVLRYVPVSRSCWWLGVRAGRFPKPLKLSERVTCWRAEDIRALCEGRGTDEHS